MELCLTTCPFQFSHTHNGDDTLPKLRYLCSNCLYINQIKLCLFFQKFHEFYLSLIAVFRKPPQSRRPSAKQQNACIDLPNICPRIFSFYEVFSENRSKTNIDLQVKYWLLLSHLNELWISCRDFLKKIQYKVSWKFVQKNPSFANRVK